MRGYIKSRIENHIKACKAHADWIDSKFLIAVRNYSISKSKEDISKYSNEVHELMKRRAEILNRVRVLSHKINK